MYYIIKTKVWILNILWMFNYKIIIKFPTNLKKLENNTVAMHFRYFEHKQFRGNLASINKGFSHQHDFIENKK